MTSTNSTTNSTTNTITTNLNFIQVPLVYSECPNISIDYAIMELLPIGSINMIIYNGIWNDIGTFRAVRILNAGF
jgi:mannose-1-phosphate guanylyltransferase